MPAPSSICSLADVQPGDRVIVREIVFDLVRNLCSPMDTCGDDVLECEAIRPRSLVLATRSGKRMEIDRFYACFVEVEHVSLVPQAGRPFPAHIS